MKSNFKKHASNAAVSTTKFVFGGIHLAASTVSTLSVVAEATIINRIDGQVEEEVVSERNKATYDKIDNSIKMMRNLNNKLSALKYRGKTKTA